MLQNEINHWFVDWLWTTTNVANIFSAFSWVYFSNLWPCCRWFVHHLITLSTLLLQDAAESWFLLSNRMSFQL